MGALTGNTPGSTYLDLVQLGKSGAGLPSHAGKEAALYDGAGYQILGRTAVRHWLDPHPDAITGSWEFSTLGDKTQAQLEALGWAFTNCTGTVTGGKLRLVATSATWALAYTTVSLTGDFDYITVPMYGNNYGDSWANEYMSGGIGVGRTTGDVAHHVYRRVESGASGTYRYVSGSFSAGAGTSANTTLQGFPHCLRIARYSGTVTLASGAVPPFSSIDNNMTTPTKGGWGTVSTVAEANTMDRLFLAFSSNAGSTGQADGSVVEFPFIRRFA